MSSPREESNIEPTNSMMQPKRIFVISAIFPPEDTAGAKTLFKLIYPLANTADFDVQITTMSPSLYSRHDHSLDDYVKLLNVHCLSWPIHRVFRRLNKYFRWYSDSNFVFPFRCKPYLRQCKPPDLYFLRGQPFSTFILAPYIKQKLLGKVVLFFSDPFASNPNPMNNLKATTKRRMAHIEANAVRSADGLIFTNRLTRDLTLNNYPDVQAKSLILSHCYLQELYSDLEFKKSDALNFTYAGMFYHNRRPFSLMQALSELNQEKPEILKGVRFHLIGRKMNEYNRTLDDLGIRDMFQITDNMPYRDTLTKLQESTVLLNIDAPGTSSPFLPSKLIDYIGTGLPIWTLSPPGPAYDSVQKYGGITTPPDDIESIKRDLVECIERCRNNDWKLNEDYAKTFDSAIVSAKLGDFLQSL